MIIVTWFTQMAYELSGLLYIANNMQILCNNSINISWHNKLNSDKWTNYAVQWKACYAQLSVEWI